MPDRSIRSIIEQSKRPVTVAPTMPVDEAARLMKRSGIGAVMVVDDERLVGIFTERDALFRVLAPRRDPHATRIATVMTRNPRTVAPDQPFGQALFMMYEGGFRHVPVVENGHPIGMVSARDALGPDLKRFGDAMADREHIGEILG